MSNDDTHSSVSVGSAGTDIKSLLKHIEALEKDKEKTDKLLKQAHAIARPAERDKFAFLPWRKACTGIEPQAGDDVVDDDEAQDPSSHAGSIPKLLDFTTAAPTNQVRGTWAPPTWYNKLLDDGGRGRLIFKASNPKHWAGTRYSASTQSSPR